MTVELFELQLRSRRVPTARIEGRDDLGAAVGLLGVSRAPVLVLVGGAAHVSEAHAELVREALAYAIVPVVERLGAAVVDGGTRAGVMKLAGDMRAARGTDFPLVGVVPAALVPQVELDERHTHFVFVPGNAWGDESELLAALATTVADGLPSVTVLANGGAIAWDDAGFSIAESRRVVVLNGSGRTADEIAAAETTRARAVQESGLVTIVRVTDTPAITTALARALGE